MNEKYRAPHNSKWRKNPLSFQVDFSEFDFVSDSDVKKLSLAQSMTKSKSFWSAGFKKLMQNPTAVISMVFLVLIILTVIILPIFWPYKYSDQLSVTYGDSSFTNLDPFEYSTTEKALLDQGEFVMPHLMGTDKLGRDYFIRVIYGARISIFVGIFAAFIVLIIGSVYGAISGYIGGTTDLIMMRIVDIIYSLPDVLIIILLSVVLREALDGATGFIATLGAGLLSIFIVFALLYWVGMARLVRGQILSLRSQEFVLASKSLGAGNFRIIFHHLLPNCIGLIIISTALEIPSAIFTESFLSFIGLGVSAPMPSLGSLCSDALSSIYSHPLLLVFPAILICVIVLAFNLLGDGMRDAFDPRMQ